MIVERAITTINLQNTEPANKSILKKYLRKCLADTILFCILSYFFQNIVKITAYFFACMTL